MHSPHTHIASGLRSMARTLANIAVSVSLLRSSSMGHREITLMANTSKGKQRAAEIRQQKGGYSRW